MSEHLKYMFILLILLPAAILLASCGTKQQAGEASADISEPARAETLDTIRFTAQLDGGETEIRFWSDGIKNYYYFLPSGCGLESFKVQTHNGITLRKEGEAEDARVTFSDGDTLEGLELNITYLLGCYDQNQYLYEVPVVFMQGANIHSVFITTEGGTIAPVLADKEQKLKGDMLVSDSTGSVVYQGSLSHIKGRGNGSWFSHKKPFNIKLSEKADLLGMGISREWCLINQETDYSCIRNKLVYGVAADAGLAYTPDSEFVDLWIDGEYFGLYLLTDRINISEGSVDITNLEEATGAVNMEKLSSYTLNVNKSDMVDASFSNIPNDPEDITGGYLLEVDKFYAADKAARFNTDRIYSVTLKSPEYISENQLNYIRGFVTEMENALADLSSTRYQDYIDIDSWVDMCVLQELMANGDFMGSSQYFYKEIDTDGGYSKLYAGPVWDMDLSLGGETKNALPVNVLMLPTSSWVKYLYQRPEYYEKLVTAYARTYRPLAQELLDYGIDSLAEQLSTSAAMNYTRWRNVAVEKTGMENPFLPSIEKLKEYLAARISLLDDLWVNKKNYHTVLVTKDVNILPYENMYYSRAYMVADSEPLGELPIPDPPEGYMFEGWYYGTPSNPGEAYDLNAPVMEDCKVYAKYIPLTPN
ncbi:CotH kinase family protein [Hungatella hathewayi]